MMKKILLTALVFIISMTVFGWGPTGHRATGWIAEQYLNAKARKNLERLLNGQSLAIASTWMDEVRSDSLFDYMNDWHWVTIPYGQTYEQSVKNPNGDVIQTIERIIVELKSNKFSAQDQALRIRI